MDLSVLVTGGAWDESAVFGGDDGHYAFCDTDSMAIDVHDGGVRAA